MKKLLLLLIVLPMTAMALPTQPYNGISFTPGQQVQPDGSLIPSDVNVAYCSTAFGDRAGIIGSATEYVLPPASIIPNPNDQSKVAIKYADFLPLNTPEMWCIFTARMSTGEESGYSTDVYGPFILSDGTHPVANIPSAPSSFAPVSIP